MKASYIWVAGVIGGWRGGVNYRLAKCGHEGILVNMELAVVGTLVNMELVVSQSLGGWDGEK